MPLECVRTRHARSHEQTDPKFLRNQKYAKKWNGKGRGSSDE